VKVVDGNGNVAFACDGATGPAGPAGPTGPAGPGNVLAFASTSVAMCAPGQTGCLSTANSTCPAGTAPTACSGFFTTTSGPNVCADGSWGIVHTFINSGNGCSVQAHRDLASSCAPVNLTLTAQARCINVP